MFSTIIHIIFVIQMWMWVYIIITGSFMSARHIWQRSRPIALVMFIMMGLVWETTTYDTNPTSWTTHESTMRQLGTAFEFGSGWQKTSARERYRDFNQYVVDIYNDTHHCYFEAFDFCWVAPAYDIGMDVCYTCEDVFW